MPRTTSSSRLDPRNALGTPALYNLHSAIFAPSERKRRFVSEFLKVVPGERVLDIGCGTALLLEYFPAVDYVGFDLSKSYVDAARTRTSFAGKTEFHHRHLSQEAARGMDPFNLAMAIGVVHHLDDDEARTLFEVAYEALKPGGRLVTCDGAFVPGQNPLARFFLKMDRGEYIRAPGDYERLARQVFSTVNASVHHNLNALPYTHCVLECVKT